MSSSPFLFGAQTPVIDVKPGLRRQILGYNDDLMLVKVFFDGEMVGKKPPLHVHPHSQSSCILSGRFEFHRGDDEPVVLGPGDAFCVDGGVPHELYCISPGIVLDSFSPAREDFLL